VGQGALSRARGTVSCGARAPPEGEDGRDAEARVAEHLVDGDLGARSPPVEQQHRPEAERRSEHGQHGAVHEGGDHAHVALVAEQRGPHGEASLDGLAEQVVDAPGDAPQAGELLEGLALGRVAERQRREVGADDLAHLGGRLVH
jgi:hypothetical protein